MQEVRGIERERPKDYLKNRPHKDIFFKFFAPFNLIFFEGIQKSKWLRN